MFIIPENKHSFSKTTKLDLMCVNSHILYIYINNLFYIMCVNILYHYIMYINDISMIYMTKYVKLTVFHTSGNISHIIC